MLRYPYKSPVFISVGISLITLITFIHVLNADFVMWDDDVIVYENPNLTGLSLDNIGWMFTHANATRRYTPLAALNYSITYQIWKLNPFGYHFSAWLLHGINAALVFFILRALLTKTYSAKNSAKQFRIRNESGWINTAAAAGSLLWSLHPLRTEPVAWVSANFYSQALFFALLSILCYLWAEAKNITKGSHSRRLLASVLLYMAALLSHPIVLGLFAVYIALDIYPLKKLDGRLWHSEQGRRALFEKIPFAAISLLIAAVTIIIRLNETENRYIPLAQFGILERIMQSMYIWAYYIWRFFYPVKLGPVYTNLITFSPLSLTFVISAITVTGGFIALVLLRKKYLVPLLTAGCYLVLLVPALGLYEHPHYPSDRYSLIISICFSALLAGLLANPNLNKKIRYTGIWLAVIAIAALGLMSFGQTKIWQNSDSLFRHALYTLGNDPYRSSIYYRLGSNSHKQGNIAQAAEYYSKSLEIRPDNANALFGLGCIAGEAGDLGRAVDYFTKSLELKPDSAQAHNSLAVALRNQGKIDEAINHFNRAIELAPYVAEFHNSFAKALINKGRIDEAVEEFNAAIKLKPNWCVPMNSLAWYIATHPEIKSRNTEKAIKLACGACEISGYRNSVYLGTLAAALASSGRFPEAVDSARKAIMLADAANQPAIKNIIERHLSLYMQQKAYVESPFGSSP